MKDHLTNALDDIDTATRAAPAHRPLAKFAAAAVAVIILAGLLVLLHFVLPQVQASVPAGQMAPRITGDATPALAQAVSPALRVPVLE